MDTPPEFRSAPQPAGTNSLADLAWWQMFQDETLQELIRVALTNNYDLRLAAARVEQARAVVVQNRAALFPWLDFQGGVARGRNSASSAGFLNFNSGANTDSFLAAGAASWEVDLWGRIRRLNEAARAQYFATREARRDVLITLISDVAQAYFQLLALDRELDIARRTTVSFDESLKIFSQRLQGGIASKLETSRAEAALASTAATVPDLERQIVIQENLINFLLGRPPGPIPRNHNLLQQKLPPTVPPGLPSALLERRPDIRQAEQQLRSANAQVGVAVANFLPQLDLTALLGKVSPEAALFTSGGANAWSIGANVTGPIFHGGQLVGRYEETKAIREQALLQYRETILRAFQEVANDLITIQKLEAARVEQARSVQAYEVAVEVSRQRYVAGRASYFELLEAQQQLFPAENALVQTQLSQLLALVQLYRALGGGWQMDSGREGTRERSNNQ